jgi:hypothetical protein
MSATRILFRPVGLKEAELILTADSHRFPPRLPEQPIFYPVLNLEYASQITREWNAPKEPHFAGFVTRFTMNSNYAARFEEHVVGSSVHRELWVPADQLDEFNSHIVGRIELVEAHYGERYQGPEPLPTNLKGKKVAEQLRIFADLYDYNRVDFACELAANKVVVQLNFAWWLRRSGQSQGLELDRKSATLGLIVETFKLTSPDLTIFGSSEISG